VTRPDLAQPGDAVTSARDSPTRRRCLALLSSLPIIRARAAGPDLQRVCPKCCDPGTDPMPRLFADFQALLDRHAVALSARDRIEAELVARLGFPRVALPRGSDGAPRHAADAVAIVQAVPPGRLREWLARRLRRRQRRWDDAALQFGLNEAELHEATLDGAVVAAADSLLATPAWTCEAAVLKLVVLLSVHAPGPTSDQTTPWRELRLILADLGGLAARGAQSP
jgi:hypothetical protein